MGLFIQGSTINSMFYSTHPNIFVLPSSFFDACTMRNKMYIIQLRSTDLYNRIINIIDKETFIKNTIALKIEENQITKFEFLKKNFK